MLKAQAIFQLFTARLPRRILMWAFISILGIETLILLPSVIRRRDELLHQVEITSKDIVSILAVRSRQDDRTLLEDLAQLKQRKMISGAELWNLNSKTGQTIGEHPELGLSEIQSGTKRKKNWSQQRFEVVYPIQVNGSPYLLVLRHPTEQITQDVTAFIWRISGLVVIISIVVTATLSVVIASTVVQPILLLRDDLLRSGKEIAQDQSVSDFTSTSYVLQDELGEVISAFHQMVGNILQAIHDRKVSEAALRESSEQLNQTLITLNSTQVRLIQTEKMASLGQLVAGIAHEINNPINFIHGNLHHVETHAQDLMSLIQIYQQETPDPSALEETLADIDLEFIQTDLPNLLSSMRNGSDRIREIVLSFRNFSRLDEAEQKRVNLHDGLESTLALLQHRLLMHPEIQVIKHYGQISDVLCYPAQINQVFFELLKNAIDALELRSGQSDDHDSPLMLTITTCAVANLLQITISDTGIGMTADVQQRAFDPFFTTKDVGQGKGLGLAIAHQTIVAGHEGNLECKSHLRVGTDLIITLPTRSKRR